MNQREKDQIHKRGKKHIATHKIIDEINYYFNKINDFFFHF